MSNKSLAKAPENLTVLVTGGAGFIGSHTAVELLHGGYNVVIVDDLSNSNEKAVDRIRTIVGPDAAERLTFYRNNVLDRQAMERVFSENDVDVMIHFAGFKAVGESVQKPLEYYRNNIGGTLVLCDVARNHGCKNIVFSSSATVYGDSEDVPFDENQPLGETTNPYGTSKAMQERILTDLYHGDGEWNIVLLRYFNPIGAHPSALIGELPRGVPQNLVPYITQTAAGLRECLSIFGDDYDTPDGTCLRDYIDVVDLAKAHVAAVDRMTQRRMKEAYEIFNIGTGTPVSVLELVKGFERANGLTLNYKIVGRRAGDVKAVWADTQRANKELGWKAERPLEETLRSAWAWEKHVRGIE